MIVALSCSTTVTASSDDVYKDTFCWDVFLNVLLGDENLRNSSMADEIRAQVYHANEWQSNEVEEEVVKNKNKIHDPNTPYDKIEPKNKISCKKWKEDRDECFPF
ncbi:unnamed protein product [Lactuca saligna]|uniref:Uncharacterized protein n=1 Tax=Lactuca saligna TaxID=75948 RepID=A0AA35Z5F2_LACSI|nr:unnamed protein product [Lactuca saligna]